MNDSLAKHFSICMAVISGLLICSDGAQASAEAHRISLSQLQTKIESALTDAGAGDAITATLSGLSGKDYHIGERMAQLDVAFLDYDDRTQRWEAELHVYAEGELVKTDSLSGRYAALVDIPVLTRRVFGGEVISEADITIARVPEHRLRSGTLHDRQQLLGMAARRVLREGQPIASHEIEPPVIVKKGEQLQLTYRTAYMELRTLAEAMEHGAAGERVTVRNLDSGQLLSAFIVAPGLAKVKSYLQLSHDYQQRSVR